MYNYTFKLHKNIVKESQNNVAYHLTSKCLSTSNYRKIINFTDTVHLTRKKKKKPKLTSRNHWCELKKASNIYATVSILCTDAFIVLFLILHMMWSLQNAQCEQLWTMSHWTLCSNHIIWSLRNGFSGNMLKLPSIKRKHNDKVSWLN